MKKLLAMMLMLLPMIAWGQEPDSIPNKDRLGALLLNMTDDNPLVQKYGDNYILVSPNNGKPEIMLLAKADDSNDGIGLLVVRNNQLDPFRTALNEIIEKSNEWILTAKENHINKLYRELPVKFPKLMFGWFYGKRLYGRKSVPIKFMFNLNGEMLKFDVHGTVVSAQNKYIQTDFSFSLNSLDEIKELIETISPTALDKIVEIYNNKVSQEDSLFH